MCSEVLGLGSTAEFGEKLPNLKSNKFENRQHYIYHNIGLMLNFLSLRYIYIFLVFSENILFFFYLFFKIYLFSFICMGILPACMTAS